MQNDCVTIFLKPGEIYVSREPVRIKTVLGSCVAVLLHDRENHVGGANHYLLPRHKAERDLLCGDIAIAELLEAVVAAGAKRGRLIAQIAGGSSKMDSVLNVGQQNIAVAREMLAAYGIPIVREEVGGTCGRVIQFYPQSNLLEIRQVGEKAAAPARLKEGSIHLTLAQTRLVEGLFTAGIHEAQKSLSTMVTRPVRLRIAEVMLRKMHYAQDYVRVRFSGFAMSCGQQGKGPFGEIMLLMEPAGAARLLNALCKRPLGAEIVYDAMAVSAGVEVANIAINAILGTFANHLSSFTMFRIPTFIKSSADLENCPFLSRERRWQMALGVKAGLDVPVLTVATSLLFVVELCAPHYLLSKTGIKIE